MEEKAKDLSEKESEYPSDPTTNLMGVDGLPASGRQLRLRRMKKAPRGRLERQKSHARCRVYEMQVNRG